MTLRGPTPPADMPLPRSGHSLASLALLTTLLILALVLGTAAMLKVSHDDTMHQEKTTLRNLAIAFSAQTLTVAQAVDQAMRQVERSYRPGAGSVTVELGKRCKSLNVKVFVFRPGDF